MPWFPGALRPVATGLGAERLTLIEQDGLHATQSSYSTASRSPSANTLQLLGVVTTAPAGDAVQPTVSGCGLTWVPVRQQLVVFTNVQITVFRAYGASPSTGALTIDFGGTNQSDCLWIWCEASDVDASQANGAAAIVKIAAGSFDFTNPQTLIDLALTTQADARNFTIGFFLHDKANGNNENASARGGLGEFAEIMEGDGSSYSVNFQAAWSDSYIAAPGCQWNGAAGAVGAIALEVGYPAAPQTRATARQRHERYTAQVLELQLDFCDNVYGVSPCTAGIVQTGTAQAGGASSITLAAGASSVDDAYNGMVVRITGGTGSGQEGTVSAYNGTTKVATVAAAWTTQPDATSTYDVIDRPNACYNTYPTCQDKTNFSRGTKTYSFCNRGMPLPPGELIHPYLYPKRQIAPTEIDPNRGLARSSKTELASTDEPIRDDEGDPYIQWRATPAEGTFWQRLLARNPNYVGRWALLRLGYVINPWNWGTFQTELYLLDAVKFGTGGDVNLTLKDPIKLADRAKVPAPTDGKLAADIVTTGATSFSVGTGEGAQYGSGTPSGTFYLRIQDEVLSATRSTDTFTTTGRGLFGTTAATHNQNDKVQLCKVYSATDLTDVLIDLLNAAGVSSSYIDTAGMASEDTRWLSTKYQITVCLTEPESPSKYISELLQQSNSMLWWEPVAQKFKFKVNMPESATVSIPQYTETANIIQDSVRVELLENERITASSLDYALKSATAIASQAENYLRGALAIDLNAQSVNEYGDVRAEKKQSRFLGSANDLAAVAFVQRDVSWRRNTPQRIVFKLDPKDYDDGIAVGALIDIAVGPITDFAGAKKTQRVRITRLRDNGADIEVQCRTTKFRSRYAFIAPAATPDYPTDDVYGHICRSTPSQTMTNGDDPYLII